MIENILIAAISASMPLVLATIGEIFCEKVGNTNLGVEGTMMMGAVMGFMVGFITGNPALAMAAAAVAGIGSNLIYAFLTVTLRANQIVTGLALTIFGSGLANFLGKQFIGRPLPEEIKASFKDIGIPLLQRIPVVGVFFKQNIMVYLVYVVVILSYIYINKTRAGLNLRAVGENPYAADSAGVNITSYKYSHILIGGMLMGLAGGYISVIKVPVWQEAVTSGRGWIAVALVIFSAWSPVRAFFASLLFGFLDILGLRLQSLGVNVSQYLIEILPYLTTLIVLVVTDIRGDNKYKAPKGLSKPYFREER